MRRTLRRRQPVDDAVERAVVGEPAGDEHEVLVLAAHPVLGLRGDARDRRAAEPADEVEVVRREVLDDADVADAVRERPDALGRHRGRPRRAGRRGRAAQRAQRGVAALDVADRADHARRRRPTSMISRASAAVAASGFSISTWTPGGGQLAHGRQVLLGRHRDDREVRALDAPSSSAIVPNTRAPIGDGAEAVAARVDGAGEAHRGVGLQDARVVAAHHPQADHRAARGTELSTRRAALRGRRPSPGRRARSPWPRRPR